MRNPNQKLKYFHLFLNYDCWFPGGSTMGHRPCHMSSHQVIISTSVYLYVNNSKISISKMFSPSYTHIKCPPNNSTWVSQTTSKLTFINWTFQFLNSFSSGGDYRKWGLSNWRQKPGSQPWLINLLPSHN